MIRLIQLPLDGSSFAEAALPWAVCVAQRNDAAIQLVRVHESLAKSHFGRQPAFEAALDSQLLAQDQAYLDAVVKRLSQTESLRVSSALVQGPVVDALVQQAAASGADVTVMTTHSRDKLERIWFGSVADALLRQSKTPILIVRPDRTVADACPRPLFRHVLVPLDGSPLAEQAIEPALALGGAEQPEVTLLRIVMPVVAVADLENRRVGGLAPSLLKEIEEFHSHQQNEAASYLEQVAEQLRARSLTVHLQVVLHDRVAAAILDEAASAGANAIALTTRGQGGRNRLLFGSVADKVIRGATTPVLVCPPSEK